MNAVQECARWLMLNVSRPLASSCFRVARKCFILPAHVKETTHVRLYACNRANREHKGKL